jgi:hypothetical protein
MNKILAVLAVVTVAGALGACNRESDPGSAATDAKNTRGTPPPISSAPPPASMPPNQATPPTSAAGPGTTDTPRPEVAGSASATASSEQRQPVGSRGITKEQEKSGSPLPGQNNDHSTPARGPGNTSGSSTPGTSDPRANK